jgi:hypothetical protein
MSVAQNTPCCVCSVDELWIDKNLKESSYGVIKALSRRSKENHVKPRDPRCPGRYSNPVPPKYESDALPLEPACPVHTRGCSECASRQHTYRCGLSKNAVCKLYVPVERTSRSQWAPYVGTRSGYHRVTRNCCTTRPWSLFLSFTEFGLFVSVWCRRHAASVPTVTSHHAVQGTFINASTSNFVKLGNRNILQRPHIASNCRSNDELQRMWKESVGRANCCWLSPVQSFLIPAPAGPMPIFFCVTAQ